MRKLKPKLGISSTMMDSTTVDYMPETSGHINRCLTQKGLIPNRCWTDSGIEVKTHRDPGGKLSDMMAQELNEIGPKRSTIGRRMMGYVRQNETMGEEVGRPIEDGLVEEFHRFITLRAGAGATGLRPAAAPILTARMGHGPLLPPEGRRVWPSSAMKSRWHATRSLSAATSHNS